MADEFLLAVNIAMATYAFIASFIFWFSWRKRPDFIYLFIAIIIYSIGHTILIIKHFNQIFQYIGNAIILVALLVLVVSIIIEYIVIMVKSRKEKVILGIATLLTILFGAITIILFYVFNILTYLNTVMIAMIVLLVPSTFFMLRIYLKQQSITRLFFFSAFIAATLASLSTIFAVYFEWGLAVNIALNFIFQTFIMTAGLAAIAEQRIIASEEKYRILSEHLEEKVTERTLQLENLNKELESFSYSVSHDLRTPLRSIAGFTKILKEEFNIKLGDEGMDYVNRVLDNTERMDELINDLLDLAQISQADFIIENVDLNSIAERIIENLKIMNPSREIIYTVDENITAQCDSKLIKIVLENLLSNAVKFTKTKDQAKISFGIIIKDNGIGFDMHYYEKLFGLFQRLHSRKNFEGTGVGLTTVKRIIDRHSGQIWAESEVDKGATFYFTLS